MPVPSTGDCLTPFPNWPTSLVFCSKKPTRASWAVPRGLCEFTIQRLYSASI
jgi:hypothetical protein